MTILWKIPLNNGIPIENATEHPFGNATENPLGNATGNPRLIISEVLISGVQSFAPTLLCFASLCFAFALLCFAPSLLGPPPPLGFRVPLRTLV